VAANVGTNDAELYRKLTKPRSLAERRVATHRRPSSLLARRQRTPGLASSAQFPLIISLAACASTRALVQRFQPTFDQVAEIRSQTHTSRPPTGGWMAKRAENAGVWRDRVKRWKQSGLSARAFAELEGLPRAGALSWWRHRLTQSQKKAPVEDAPLRLVRVDTAEVVASLSDGRDCHVDGDVAADHRARSTARSTPSSMIKSQPARTTMRKSPTITSIGATIPTSSNHLVRRDGCNQGERRCWMFLKLTARGGSLQWCAGHGARDARERSARISRGRELRISDQLQRGRRDDSACLAGRSRCGAIRCRWCLQRS
jgi:hypothetical protein